MIELQNAQAMMEELGIGPGSAKQEDDMGATTQKIACDPLINESPTAEELINNKYFEVEETK